MRLEIDRARCDGHGLCHALLPDRVALDDWGYPLLDDTGAPDERAARRAVAACPSLALRLES